MFDQPRGHALIVASFGLEATGIDTACKTIAVAGALDGRLPELPPGWVGTIFVGCDISPVIELQTATLDLAC
jgi:hypothetical protein